MSLMSIYLALASTLAFKRIKRRLSGVKSIELKDDLSEEFCKKFVPPRLYRFYAEQFERSYGNPLVVAWCIVLSHSLITVAFAALFYGALVSAIDDTVVILISWILGDSITIMMSSIIFTMPAKWVGIPDVEQNNFAKEI